MEASRHFSRVAVAIAFAVLPGCSGIVSGAPAPTGATSLEAPGRVASLSVASASPGPMTFVADGAADAVFIYNSAGKKIGQISGYSGPLAADADANVYVVSSFSGAIDIFAKPYDGKPKVLTASPYVDDVAVADGSGLVAAVETVSQSGGSGSVSLFKKGAVKPCMKIAAFSRTYFAAFDSTDNLFVDGVDAKGDVAIGEISGGCAAKTVRLLTTGNAIRFPGGVAVDRNDRIAIDDQEASTIYTYGEPKNGALGKPVLTTKFSASDAIAFVFANDGRDIYDYDAGLGQVNEFAFPSGGSPIATLDAGGSPSGVAVVPVVEP